MDEPFELLHPEARKHVITKETATRMEYHFCDQQGAPVHKSRVVYKNEPKLVIFPFTYSQSRGVSKKKISEIEYRGWPTVDDIPRFIRPNDRLKWGDKRTAFVMRLLTARFPKLTKVIFTKSGSTRLSSPTATFAWKDFEEVCREVGREITLFDTRRKLTLNNALANHSTAFAHSHGTLNKGGLAQLLEPYGSNITLSQDDTDKVLELVNHVPVGSVTVTANYIQTKNKVNVAYLENVISEYERLLKVTNDNEKDWQAFFDKHAWILANVFPYQVILHKKEAYVGGKTIEDSEGRVVDFLFQNGFRDNYALLEIKTHTKTLIRATPYRAPDAYAAHDDCSGAISQCLDQKNTFLTDMGQKAKSLDPKCVLIIGRKSDLNSNQSTAFELMRANQKNVDVVTFDEVLEKIRGLRSILQKN